MVRAAAARGAEVADLLAAAGLTLEFLEDPDARIPAPKVFQLWDALRERTGDAALQLTAPTALPFGAYRVMDYLVATSATVGDGFRRFAKFFALIADSLTIDIAAQDDEWRVCLARADGGAVPPVYVDYVFAALVTRIRMRIRPGLQLSRVDLRQPAPLSVAPHEAVFAAPVHFGASEDRICFTRAEWDAPTNFADEALVTVLEDHARVIAGGLGPAPGGFRRDVEEAIAATLSSGAPATAVARELNVSVRTLQRRLVEVGISFRDLADSVRRRFAEGYLKDPKVSISEVTFLLGFSEESAFNRAFTRWTGASPGRWRRAFAQSRAPRHARSVR